MPHDASPDHVACKKCKLHTSCDKAKFLKPIYRLDGKWVEGVPPNSKEYTLVVGGEPKPIVDETGSLEHSDDVVILEKVAEKQNVLDKIWFVPGVLCRPVADGAKRVEGRLTKGEMTRCWTKHIEPIVKDHPPRAILCMGAVASFGPLKHLNPKGTEKQWQKYADSGILAYTTRSVDDLLLHADDEATKKQFLEAFDYAFTHRPENIVVDIPYIVANTLERVIEWFKPVLASLADLKSHPLSWDTETSSVNDRWKTNSTFRICLWSFDHPAQKDPLLIPTTGYTPLSHEGTPLINRIDPATYRVTESEEKRIVQWLAEQVLTAKSVPKLGQNLQYDELAIWVAYKIKVEGFHADTQILDFLIDPDEKMHGLDLLVKRHLPTVPHYWEALEEWKSMHPDEVDNYGYTRVPPEILFPYAAWDTKATSMLYPIYRNILEVDRRDQGWFILAQEPPDTTTLSPWEYAVHGRSIHHRICTHLERVGIAIDVELLGLVNRHYDSERSLHRANLSADPELLRFEQEMLPSVVSKSAASAKAFKKFNIPHTINWKSPVEVPAFFLKFLKDKDGNPLPVLRRTEKGSPSFDEEAIDGYANQFGIEVAGHLGKWRKADKFITSFLNPLAAEKGVLNGNIVHANYKSASTATGRLSCGSSYPMQAIPREGNIKKIFISRWPGGWMLTRDYSGIEVRVLAIVSKDPTLCKALREGKDPHFITQQFFFREKADAKNKTQRSICKRALFGRLYGQGDKGLFDLLTSEGIISVDTGLPITLPECARFNEMIDQLYPGVANWVALAHEQGLSHFFCCSLFGFIRQLPGARFYSAQQEMRQKYTWDQLRGDEVEDNPEATKENQRIHKQYRRISAMVAEAQRHSQNAPIQSSASDLTVFAAHVIQRRLDFEEIQAVVVAIVHDDIWLDVARSEDIPRASAIMRDVMNNPQEWLPALLPGFECPWLDIPIIGEAEVGLSPMDSFPIVNEPTCGSTFEPGETQGDLLLKVDADVAKTYNMVDTVFDAEGKKAVVPWAPNVTQLRAALDYKRLRL